MGVKKGIRKNGSIWPKLTKINDKKAHNDVNGNVVVPLSMSLSTFTALI